MAFVIQRVLVSDEIDEICLTILRQDGIEVVKNTKLSHTELVEEIKNYDALIVRSATKVDAEVLSSGTRLKVVGRAGVGVDNIDCDIATARGILVLNTPAGNTLSAAEHTCAMLCSLSRHIPRATASMKAGKWDRKSFMGNELMGKTLAVIGLGRIGREVALRMQSFGMKTIGFDPLVSAEAAAQFNVQSLPLDSIWPLADFFTIHTPLIPQTKDLFSKDTFAKCKKGFRIINCARGGIINEADLLEALKSGQCGGAALDVFLEEPPTSAHTKDLIQHENLVCTPHLGASTHEAQVKVAEEVAQAFVALSNGRGLYGAVNGHALAQAIAPASTPLVKLCTSLGKLLAHLVPNAKEFNVSLSVPGYDKPPSFVEAAAAIGFLSSQVKNHTFNLINAPLTAKQLGIQVKIQMNPFNCAGGISFFTECDKNVSGVVCGEEPVLTEFCGDQLSQPLILSREGNSHLYVVKRENASQLWSWLTSESDKAIAVTNGKRHVFLLASEAVQLTDTVFSCPL